MYGCVGVNTRTHTHTHILERNKSSVLMSFQRQRATSPVAQWLRLWVSNVGGVDSNAAWSHMLQCGPKKRQRGGLGRLVQQGGHRFRPSLLTLWQLVGWRGGGLETRSRYSSLENDSGKGAPGRSRLRQLSGECVFVSNPGTGRVRWACASRAGGRPRGEMVPGLMAV